MKFSYQKPLKHFNLRVKPRPSVVFRLFFHSPTFLILTDFIDFHTLQVSCHAETWRAAEKDLTNLTTFPTTNQQMWSKHPVTKHTVNTAYPPLQTKRTTNAYTSALNPYKTQRRLVNNGQKCHNKSYISSISSDMPYRNTLPADVRCRSRRS